MRPLSYRIWRRCRLIGHALFTTGSSVAVTSGLRTEIARDREIEKLAIMPAVTRAECFAVIAHAWECWARDSGTFLVRGDDTYELAVRGTANDYLIENLRSNEAFALRCGMRTDTFRQYQNAVYLLRLPPQAEP